VCRQRAVCLQADGPFHRGGDAVVQAPGAARLADTARVTVRVDGDPLADAPAADVAPDASYTACRLMSHDESAEVDLGEIGGVQVTSADATQVNVHEHLVVAGRRHESALEPTLAIFGQHHRQHLARSAARLTRRIGVPPGRCRSFPSRAYIEPACLPAPPRPGSGRRFSGPRRLQRLVQAAIVQGTRAWQIPGHSRSRDCRDLFLANTDGPQAFGNPD
jgi:hypothetical protein